MFDWDLEPEALDLDPEVFRSLHVSVRLDVQPDNVFVRLTANGVARLTCDRTLAPYDESVSGSHALLFVTRGSLDAIEDTTDDVVELGPDEEEIDLTSVIRDTFLLALPHRRIAPGAEALDLPMQYGAPAKDDDMVDPRWEALKKWRGGATSS